MQIDGDILGEEVEYDPSMTFQQMNLSRPLQKVSLLVYYLVISIYYRKWLSIKS